MRPVPPDRAPRWKKLSSALRAANAVLVSFSSPKHRRFWLVGICLFASLLSGCAKKDPNRLVIGMELSSPPFEMTDEANRPAGIGVEMASALAGYLHKEAVLQNTKFEALIPALQTNRIDLIISSMTATEERSHAISFSDPYVHISICLLVSAKSSLQAGDELNLPGRRIVVKSGTTGAVFAREHLPRAEVIQVGDEAACVLEVIQGKADAFIYDQVSVYQLQKRNPDTTRAIFQPLQRENWAIGINKKNEALRQQVNSFLADYRRQHGLEKLAAKYLQDRDALAKMGDPFSFE